MTHLILSRAQIGGTAALGRNRSQVRVEPVFQTPAVHWVIRYLFYAFIFVLPFEEAYIPGGTTSVPKLLGLALAAVALLQRHVCYRFPPKALWWFLVYFLVFATWSAYLVLFPPQVPDSSIAIIRQFVRLAQLLALFWLSYNLMKEERVINGMLWVLGGSTILLAVLQLLGITSEVSSGSLSCNCL